MIDLDDDKTISSCCCCCCGGCPGRWWPWQGDGQPVALYLCMLLALSLIAARLQTARYSVRYRAGGQPTNEKDDDDDDIDGAERDDRGASIHGSWIMVVLLFWL